MDALTRQRWQHAADSFNRHSEQTGTWAKGCGAERMNFIGATRKQAGKSINDDAFTVFNGTFAFLLDGAGNVRGAAKRSVDTIRGQYQQQNLMPSFPYLINLLNMSLIGLDAESTLVGIEIKQGNFLTGVSCGDSPL